MNLLVARERYFQALPGRVEGYMVQMLITALFSVFIVNFLCDYGFSWKKRK